MQPLYHQKVRIVVSILSIMALLIVVLACAKTTPATTQPPQLIVSFEGEGDNFVGSSSKNTQSFKITNTQWLIESSCYSLKLANSPVLIINIYPAGKPTNSINLVNIVSQNSPGMATNYVHQPGEFYLQIIGMNIKNWTVKVYQ
jgi:hypothetical protein